MTDTNTDTNNRRTFTRELRVRLDEAEITERGRKLASRRADRAQLDEKRKAVAKDYGGQLAQIDAELDGLQSAITSGSELRPVQCYEVFVGGVINVHRADTDAVIDTRTPTLSEQQVALPGLDDEEGDDWGYDGSTSATAPKLELVRSATGDEVAHMPDDDDGEVPDPGALDDLAPPAKPSKPARAKAKSTRKGK